MDLEHLDRLWPRVLEALERDAPPTRGFLDGSRPAAVDEQTLGVTVTSPMRAEMLGKPEHRERVRAAVAAVVGRTLEVDFQAGAPASTEAPGPGAPAPRDDDALLEDLKTMFSAVEEGGERGDPGGR